MNHIQSIDLSSTFFAQWGEGEPINVNIFSLYIFERHLGKIYNALLMHVYCVPEHKCVVIYAFRFGWYVCNVRS